MDTKRNTAAARFPHVYEQIEANIQESGRYDLILSSDDNALEFLLRYKDELAREAPVIFFGINNTELAQRAVQRKEYSGLTEQASLMENVELAFKLFPKLGTLHVIADASASGQADLEALQLNLPPGLASRVGIEDLSRSTFSKMAARMHAYPEGDAILFLSAYIDGAGGNFDFLESVLWLRQHTQIPVLHPYEHGIGQGFLGGRVISHYRMAQRATELAEGYLSGRSLPENQIVEADFNVDYFDYKEMQRYSIPPSHLPHGAIVLNKPLSFFTKYKAYCIAAFIIAVLLATSGQIVGLMYLRQRRLLRELRESEGQTASLFENSYTPILLIEPDEGRILDANPAALAYYGYSKKALTQLNLAEIDGGSFASMDRALDRISNGECESYQSQHRLRNGEQRQVEMLFTCIEREQRPVLFSIVRDTTTQRDVEETLAAEQMRLLNILSGTNVGTWEWHVPSGKICLNQRWVEIIGYTLDELTPLTVKTWENLCHPDDLPSILKRVDDHFSGKLEYYSCEFRMRHKDGSWVWILDRGQVGTWVEPGRPEWMYGTQLDITELKESEVALIEAKETAEAASQAKNVFLATMSHELRTPLNPIIGFTDLLIGADNLTDEQRSWLQITKSRSRDLLLLIEDILDIARIEAGRVVVEEKPTLVQDIIDDIFSIFGRSCSDKGLTLNCEVAAILNSPCLIDPARTRQILLNLVGNAIKFSFSGEINIIAQLDPPNTHGNAKSELHLIVRDQGSGISREKQDLVFQEFQQIDSSDSREHEGSGLGLAICKRLAELMGGRIWIDEDYQQGAEFHVRFPTSLSFNEDSLVEDDVAVNREDAEVKRDRVQRPAKHVLLVEDDQSNAKLVMVCLERKQLQVTYVKNGQAAIESCAAHRFDIILMDLKMPGMSGFEAIRILRDSGNQTPIVVLTALALDSVREKLNGVDFSGVLYKPVKIAVLEEMIDRILEESALA
ncbi:ATP-binding protein [Thalassobacterium sedimentorum]|nr:ATP-binding protein [Coraliomargarita sp. SDUM461004]